MKLNLSQLSRLVYGAVHITEEDGSLTFYRFTDEQSQLYKQHRNPEYQRKTFSSAGIRMSLATDSKHLGFDYKLGYGSSRMFGYFDVAANGVLVAHAGADNILHHTGRVEVVLPSGRKTVDIYFPWSKSTELFDFTLDDDCELAPIKRELTLLAYGDSITHGYDAEYPSLTYFSQLCDRLGADGYNRAIGGDGFFPELLDSYEPVEPDIVVSAYGTNNWNTQPRPAFTDVCREWHKRLSEKFPDAKIFVITPIWRADGDRESKFGSPLEAACEVINDICEPYRNIKVIDGQSLMPRDTGFYSDKYLHPNDLGFCRYADRLYHEMINYL